MGKLITFVKIGKIKKYMHDMVKTNSFKTKDYDAATFSGMFIYVLRKHIIYSCKCYLQLLRSLSQVTTIYDLVKVSLCVIVGTVNQNKT